jgi:hypothetical protein
MTPPAFFCLRTAALSLCLAAAGLAGCGGGGGEAAPEPGATASPLGTGTGGGNNADTTPESSNSPSNAAVLGAARALGVAGSVVLAGVPEVPARAAALATPTGGRLFHVDSRNGNDSNDGLAASPGNTGSGPWRSLARLQAAPLAPGDRVQLACASEWNETLRLPASGTAALPITVAAPPAGCTARPVIDGSVLLPAAVWVQQQGRLYRASLAGTPLLLNSATATAWTEAHHPNRGHKADEPGSLYLAAAADSAVTLVGGQRASTTIETGADLQLPAGASLGAGTRARIRLYAWTMQEKPVAGFNGRQITLAQPTTYPLGAGWGYYLLGQRWMVDSPGE